MTIQLEALEKRYADGTHACGFELQTDGYAGSTTIVFTPR